MDAELKTYLDGKFSEARIDLNARFSELRAEMDARFNEDRVERRTEIEKTETNLLRALHNWARPMEIRVRESGRIAS